MKRFPSGLFDRIRARTGRRRKRSLDKAAREMMRGNTDDGTIWRSGRGGGHHR